MDQKELARELKEKRKPLKEISEITGLTYQQLVWQFYGEGRRKELRESNGEYFNVDAVVNWLV